MKNFRIMGAKPYGTRLIYVNGLRWVCKTGSDDRQQLTSFGTRGSQVQILPLRPMLSRQYNDHPHRLRHRFVAVFKSFNDAWADTTTAHGRLMLTVLGDLRPINARF
jgi:hypothetical protein